MSHKKKRKQVNQPVVMQKDPGSIRGLIKSNLLLLAIFVIFGFILYGRVLNGEFLTADDMATIVEDPLSRDFKASVQTGSFMSIYEAGMYQLFNYTSTGFHLASTILHIINAFLAFLLISRLYNQKTALLASLLFFVHPVNSETVSWISAFVYLLIGFVNLVVFLCLVEYRKSGNSAYLIGGVVTFASSLISIRTPWLLTVPISVMVLDSAYFYEKGKSLKENLIQKFNGSFFYFLAAGIYFATELVTKYAVRISDLKTYHYLDPTKSEPLINRYSYTITKSLELLLFPVNLTIFHEGEIITPAKLIFIISIASLFIVLILLLIFKRYFETAVLLLMIYILILPSFSPVIVAWFIAERYLYIPSLFFAVLVVTGLMQVEKNFKLNNFVTPFMVFLILMFSIKTFVRAGDWQNDKKLWLATLEVSPLSYRVYNNLGDVYFKEGNYPLAIKNFEIAYQIKPDYADAVHNIGHTYMQAGNLEEAKKYLQLSFQMNPRMYLSLFKLGIIEYQQGNLLEAKRYFEGAAQIEPNFEQAKTALMQLNKYIEENKPAE